VKFIQSMLSVDEALSLILSTISPNQTISSSLLDAVGLTSSKVIKSPISLPTWPNSAMDGYAVISKDIQAATPRAPVALDLVSAVSAGSPTNIKVTSGKGAQIATGGLIPHGADCVVPIELTSANSSSRVLIKKPVQHGSYIRPAGEDVAAGATLVNKNTIITPAIISLLAAVGLSSLSVIQRPRVGVASTGNELLKMNEPLSPGKIYDSNAYALMSLVKSIGAIPIWLGMAKDTKRSVSSILRKGACLDLVLTSGGVSKGHLDLVKDVLADAGCLDFWSIRMRPGKPLVFGRINYADNVSTPYIGLPGNPVSTLVAFEILVRPAILKMMGISSFDRPTIKAKLEDDIYNPDKRRVFARVSISKKGSVYYARLTGPQGSNIISSFANADGLAICPEDTMLLKKGSFAEVKMLNWT
jgi:molybdopterin molybdotransferase